MGSHGWGRLVFPMWVPMAARASHVKFLESLWPCERIDPQCQMYGSKWWCSTFVFSFERGERIENWGEDWLLLVKMFVEAETTYQDGAVLSCTDACIPSCSRQKFQRSDQDLTYPGHVPSNGIFTTNLKWWYKLINIIIPILGNPQQIVGLFRIPNVLF